jgi:hypothetical protein
MFNSTLLDTLNKTASDSPGPLLSKTLFFHDIRITCQTNHPTILAMLDDMLGIYTEPIQVRGEVTYSIFCYNTASQFPVQLPHDRIRTEAVRLLTKTKLKYYLSTDYTTQYHSYIAMPPVNEAVLTVICPHDNIGFTQLEMPERYQAKFLRRYVLLIALGQLTRPFGFEPCHAAAITAPWDNQQGALIIGASGSGKTTLSLGCAVARSGLLGDDLVMLRNDAHLINAYTIMREVSVRSDSLDLWQALSFLRAFPADDRDKHYCTIEQIRTGATRIQTPIRLLIFPSLSTKKESKITPLNKTRTLHMLIDECLSKNNRYPQAQEQFFSLLCMLSEQAKGYQLEIAHGTTDGPRIVKTLFTGSS